MSIMITLKNIKKTGKTIEADFYPESTKVPGRVVLDLETEELILKENPAGYRNSSSDTPHARQALIELAQKETLPEVYTIMWY